MSGSNLSPIFHPAAANCLIALIRLLILGALLSNYLAIFAGDKLKATTQFDKGLR